MEAVITVPHNILTGGAASAAWDASEAAVT